jgi:DNA mismatch repair protein MutS2
VRAHFRHALDVLEYDRIREVLTSYAASALGRQLAGRMQPLSDLEALRRQHAETAEMRSLLAGERLPLSGLSDVAGELASRAEHGRPLEPEVLCRVVDLLDAGRALRHALARRRQELPRLGDLGGALEDLPQLREEIRAAVDPREGVLDGASAKLSELRSAVRALRDSLRERAIGILQRPSLRRAFQAEGVTLKNDRYLVPVKADYRSSVHGPIRDRSQSGATLYVEPEEIVIDGDRLLELLDQERDEVLRVLWDLSRQVLAHRAVLEGLQRRLAWIDFTYAKASYAAAFGLECPEVAAEGALELREARHPYLLWLARDAKRDLRSLDVAAMHRAVVPLSVRFGEKARILIVTGPNTGGKTVALKTVGLNVLLALSGVPISAAAGTRVPLYNDLFVDIGDEQSIEQNLSTFSSHLRQIVEVLRHATRRSLVLLDELGSGTDPLEGAALGRALLDHFRAQSWTVIITTHLGSLKEYAYLHEEAENAAMEFDPSSLRPTYRLLMGIPGSSNALAVARRLGVPKEVVQAAEEEIALAAEPTRDIIRRMEHSKRRVEKERRRAERERRRVQSDAQEYERRLDEVVAQKQALQAEADVEVDKLLRAARSEIEPLLVRLRNVPQAHRALVDELEGKVDLLLTSTPLGAKREAFARSLRKEDEVFVPKFRGRGKVQRINKGERTLTVLLNGIPTELSFDDVSWIEGAAGGIY